MTLVEDIACVVARAASRRLPEAGAAAARTRLLHVIGVALGSRTLPVAEVAWRVASSAPGTATAIGRGRVAMQWAAFYNGVAAHASLLEDCGPGGLSEGSHPGTYVVPAAVAAADGSGASGDDLIRGIVAGYEAVSRLGAAAPPEIVSRRFRPIGVVGAFGAAAAAGTIAGLDVERLASALALATTMAGGISQGFADGTMEPILQAGFAASNGIVAAALAAEGAVTSPLALEGPFGLFATFGGAEGAAAAALEERPQLAVARIGTKRFASCVQNQATIELLLDKAPELTRAEDVERVVLSRPARGTHGLNSPGVDSPGPYNSMLQRQMSARFTAAAALLRRPVEQPSWFAEAASDAEVAALAARIELVAVDGDEIAVDLHLRNGDRVRLRTSGAAVLFPSAAEIRERFVRRAAPLLGQTGAADVADAVDDLPSVHDLRRLTDLLTLDERIMA